MNPCDPYRDVVQQWQAYSRQPHDRLMPFRNDLRTLVNAEADMVARIMDMSEEKIRAYVLMLGLEPEKEIRHFHELVVQARERINGGYRMSQKPQNPDEPDPKPVPPPPGDSPPADPQPGN